MSDRPEVDCHAEEAEEQFLPGDRIALGCKRFPDSQLKGVECALSVIGVPASNCLFCAGLGKPLPNSTVRDNKTASWVSATALAGSSFPRNSARVIMTFLRHTSCSLIA